MGNLASQQLSSQSDPDVVRRQILADREKQLSGISNPQQQLAARLGGLLGGGLVNVAQDRGFFEVNDPLLTKVSKIQNIYNEVAGRIDPTADPVKFYSALQSAYSQANLGREALAASQEGAKAKLSGLDLTLKETSLLEKSPEFIAQKIKEAQDVGNDQEVARLTGMQTRLNEDRQLNLDIKKTAILKDKAYIAYQNKLATDDKFEYKPVIPTDPLSGYYKFDKSGKADPVYVPPPKEIVDKYNSSSSTAKKGKLTQEEINAQLRVINPTSSTSNAQGGAGNTNDAADSLMLPEATVAATAPAPAVANTSAPVSRLPYDSRAGTYDLNKNPVVSYLLEQRKNVSNPQALSAIDQSLQVQLQQLIQQYPGVQFVGGR